MKLVIIHQNGKVIKEYHHWYIMPVMGMMLMIDEQTYKVKDMKASGPNLNLLEVWVEEV